VPVTTPTPPTADPNSHRNRFQSAAAVTHHTLGWLLAASATILAASGQVEYAVTADITDLRRFLVPAILEIAAIFLILGGYLRACDGDSPALLWLLAATVTGFATWTNLTHGGPRAGRIFAAATVITFILWLLKLRDRYRAARRASGLIDAPTAKFRLIRWIVMPRLTARAWLIAVEYSLRDADDALDRARLWHDTARDTYTDTTGTKRHRRAAAHRAATLAVRRRHDPTTTTASTPALIQTDRDPRHREPRAPRTKPGRPATPPARRHAFARSAAEASREAADGVHTTPTPGDGAASATRTAGPAQQPSRPGTRPANAETGNPPERLPGAGIPAREPYEPASEEDRVMYQTWLDGVTAGHEPTGADLARAVGRASDSTGTGRRAARRYRNAHTGSSPTGQAVSRRGIRDLQTAVQPTGM
jgi:hypothetical protein